MTGSADLTAALRAHAQGLYCLEAAVELLISHDSCGYYHLLEAMNDPTHPDRDELTEWLGGTFDPQRFDTEGVNARLARLR